ncbi:MAG TPA: hypothetical protein VG899_06830 [Mycobacteriales bacterium]|nr:hypothetical protein [Mycobacteriales bacterium]
MRTTTIKVAALAIGASGLLLANLEPAAASGSPKAPISVSFTDTVTPAVEGLVDQRPFIAEAPDGTVYYASGSSLYEVKDRGTPSDFADVTHQFFGLTVGGGAVVAQTVTDVTAYSPAGSQLARWSVTGAAPVSDLVAGRAKGTGLVVWVEAQSAAAKGPSVMEELQVGKAPRVLASKADSISNPVIDGAGDLFYVTTAGRIARVTPSGKTASTKAATFAESSLSYVDGLVLASVGDGAHIKYSEIDPSTLAIRKTALGSMYGAGQVLTTTIGDLAFLANCPDFGPCTSATIQRIGLPATVEATLRIKGSPQGLIGPQPVVVMADGAANASKLIWLK